MPPDPAHAHRPADGQVQIVGQHGGRHAIFRRRLAQRGPAHARVHIRNARLRINPVDGREGRDVNDDPRGRLRLAKLRVGLTLLVGACLAVHRHREPMLPRKTHA